MKHTPKNGFTLMELLIAMAIASILGVILVTTYELQVRGKNTQGVLTDMNQTARVALEIMTNEIRMAGLDPTENANARIILADDGELIFSLDRSDGATNAPDGDCCDGNEVIRYHLSPAGVDANDDGVNDNIAAGVECNLGRETGVGLDLTMGCGNGRSGLQPLGPNVDAVNFVYLADDDTNVPADADNLPDVLATPVATQALRDAIRSIQVTIVARAGTESGGLISPFTNNAVYANQQGQTLFTAPGDRFRRLLLTTTINCRNLGI